MLRLSAYITIQIELQFQFESVGWMYGVSGSSNNLFDLIYSFSPTTGKSGPNRFASIERKNQTNKFKAQFAFFHKNYNVLYELRMLRIVDEIGH